jgi:phage repressor protein C with HTH and peptisase S24 domain
MLRIFRVSGSSMEPALSDGDYVVAATKLWRPRVEKMVVVSHQEYGILVKRVQRHSAHGYTLASDNPLGTDSRTLGNISEQQVIGPVLLSIRRPGAPKRIRQNHI